MRTQFFSLLFTFLFLNVLAVHPLYAQKTLERLLQEAKYDYNKTEIEGLLKIPFEVEDQGMMIFARERIMFEDKKWETKLVYFYTRALSIPEGFKFSVDMLKKLARLNDDIPVGRLSIAEDGDILYNSSFYLDAADTEMMKKEFYLAFVIKNHARDELLPFLEEQK